MKQLYLIRHGLPDFPNGERMCLGITDIPLGPEGFRQAAEMAKQLPPVTTVFSSPLHRAVQTADAIGLPVTILPDLRERYAGEWDGLTFAQIRRQYPELYAARGLDPTLPLPGGESDGESLRRFQDALRQAVALSPGDLAVVAHGGVISLLLEHLTGRRYKPGYAQIIHLIIDPDGFHYKEELL